MNQYSEYSDKLNNYIKLPISFIIVVVIVIISLLFLCIKIKYKQMALITLIGGVVISLIIYMFCVFPYQQDVSFNSYEQYTGNFVVEKYYFVNRGGTYVLIRFNEEEDTIRFKVLTDMPSVQEGSTYNGTIVFSKHSKCLVDIDLKEK
jgi:glucan phosphoethanolaminetransferase (alkaline phosphatase superfamily)